MPADSAAAGFEPTARSMNPRRVRNSSTPSPAASASPTASDRFAGAPRSAGSQTSSRGSTAAAPISVVRTVALTNSGLPTAETSAAATKFSMIVLITSCAPKRALSTPGIAPQPAPAAAAASSASGSCTPAGRPVSEAPARPAAKPPRYIWPSTPMLNRPARKPSATASPVNSRGVARNRVCPMP